MPASHKSVFLAPVTDTGQPSGQPDRMHALPLNQHFAGLWSMDSVASPSARSHRPELLAPAGDFGLRARRRSKTGPMRSTSASMPASTPGRARPTSRSTSLDELMAFLHRRGVKGYVTLNTLVFSDELADVERIVRRVARARRRRRAGAGPGRSCG